MRLTKLSQTNDQGTMPWQWSGQPYWPSFSC